MGILKRKTNFSESLAVEIYKVVTFQARKKNLYHDYQIPDTPEGRFEVLSLHLSLFLRRLKFPSENEHRVFEEISQELSNWIVADIEESLRIMPLSDLKITHHLKGFMEGFYGRLVIYDKALECQDKNLLKQALKRNIYGITDCPPQHIVEKLVSYTNQMWSYLQSTSLSQIMTDLKGDI